MDSLHNREESNHNSNDNIDKVNTNNNNNYQHLNSDKDSSKFSQEHNNKPNSLRQREKSIKIQENTKCNNEYFDEDEFYSLKAGEELKNDVKINFELKDMVEYFDACNYSLDDYSFKQINNMLACMKKMLKDKVGDYVIGLDV